MLPELLANAVWTTIALVAVVVCYTVVIRPMMVDIYRDRVGAIREAVLVYASGGDIPARHPAVARLSAFADALSDLADELTLPRFVAMTAACRRLGFTTEGETFDALLADVKTPSVRRRLTEFHNDLAGEMLRHLLVGSLIGWMAFAITYPVFLVHAGLGRVRETNRMFRRLVTKLPPGLLATLENEVATKHAACA